MRSLTTSDKMIQYIFTAVVVFLGLVIGLIIAHFAKEELKPGKKYFVLLQRLLVLIIAGVFMYSFHTRIYIIIIALFILSTLIYQFEISLSIYYIIFGVLYFFSPEPLTISALMFLFGLPSGALFYSDKKEVLLSLLFFVPVLVFYSVRQFLM